MGKTVPSYRMAIEGKLPAGKAFRNALPSDGEKQAFDEMMDMCRTNAMAGVTLVSRFSLSQWQ